MAQSFPRSGASLDMLPLCFPLRRLVGSLGRPFLGGGILVALLAHRRCRWRTGRRRSARGSSGSLLARRFARLALLLVVLPPERLCLEFVPITVEVLKPSQEMLASGRA
jgi:hypothetical protein